VLAELGTSSREGESSAERRADRVQLLVTRRDRRGATDLARWGEGCRSARSIERCVGRLHSSLGGVIHPFCLRPLVCPAGQLPHERLLGLRVCRAVMRVLFGESALEPLVLGCIAGMGAQVVARSASCSEKLPRGAHVPDREREQTDHPCPGRDRQLSQRTTRAGRTFQDAQRSPVHTVAVFKPPFTPASLHCKPPRARSTD
jgi:hypothetical protein